MIFFEILKPMGADFWVYYESAIMFLHGLNPYRALLDRTFPLNYPPPIALFIFPLGLFDWQTASVLWNVFSTLALLISILLMAKVAGIKSRLVKVWLLFLFTFPFFPVKFNIGNGQINNYLLLFVVLSLFFYQLKRKSLAAFFLAFATGIKFAPAVFLLYFVIKKDWDMLKRTLLALLFIFLIPFLFIPFSFQLDYYQQVLPLSFTSAVKDWYYNQSLWGFLARSFSNQSFVQIVFYLLSGFIVFLTWWRGRYVPWKRALAAVSTLYLLIHPIALQHYFGFAIIPLILLGSEAKGKDWLVLAIAYIFLAIDIKNFNQVPREFNFILSHDFYAVLILWLFALWRSKFWDIIRVIWILSVVLAYILVLLCRAKICF